MATSTLYQSSPLGSPAGSPRSCFYQSPQQTLQPKADWRASFTRAWEPKGLPAPKPLILRQQNGVWLPNFSDVTTPTNDARTKPQPEAPSAPSRTVAENITSPPMPRLSLGRVPKMLRCHVCRATIREQYFQNHLFFGVVRCDLCDIVCENCPTFERLKGDVERGYSLCQHSFSYSEDPFDFLLPRLSGSDDMDVGGSVTLPNKLRVLQHYVNQLTSIQLREPWCTAVRKCKSRLLKAHIAAPSKPLEDVKPEEDPLRTGEDPLGIEDNSYSSPSPSSENNECDGSLQNTPERLAFSSPGRQDSQEEEDAGVLLTQSYDLEHLEQSVEYVELEEQCKMVSMQNKAPVVQGKSKKHRKVDHYKKLKSHKVTPSHRKKRPPMAPASTDEVDEDESQLVMEEVAMPENGYYLMVREAVEECPMCYERLIPNRCSVNLRTFLFTVTCSECGLLIYIVPDLPGGLKIVTDSGGGGMTTEKKQSNHHKTSKKVRPRDFFAK